MLLSRLSTISHRFKSIHKIHTTPNTITNNQTLNTSPQSSQCMLISTYKDTINSKIISKKQISLQAPQKIQKNYSLQHKKYPLQKKCSNHYKSPFLQSHNHYHTPRFTQLNSSHTSSPSLPPIGSRKKCYNRQSKTYGRENDENLKKSQIFDENVKKSQICDENVKKSQICDENAHLFSQKRSQNFYLSPLSRVLMAPPTLMGFTLFPQRPSPFDDPADNVNSNGYNPNDIHFDLSGKTKPQYRLNSFGEEIELEPGEEKGLRGLVEQELIPRINKVVEEVVPAVERAIDDLHDIGGCNNNTDENNASKNNNKNNNNNNNNNNSNNNNTNPSNNNNNNNSPNTPTNCVDEQTNNTSPNDSNDDNDEGLSEEESKLKHKAQYLASKLQKIIHEKHKTILNYMSKLSKHAIEQHLLLRSSVIAQVKVKVQKWYNYWFPSDIIDVVDLSIDQMIRIVTFTVSLIKGYCIGGVVAFALKASLMEYTKMCFNLAFYPYLAFYVLTTSYMMANFIHIGAVLVIEFPILKQFILLAVQLHKLSTAPAYVVARVVFKFARELLKAHDKQLLEVEENEKKQQLLLKEQREQRERNNNNNNNNNHENGKSNNSTSFFSSFGKQQDEQQHQFPTPSTPFTDSNYPPYPSFNSDGSLDDIVNTSDNTGNTNGFTNNNTNNTNDITDDDSNDPQSFIDELSSALSLDSFKSPTDILSELHTSLEKISEDAESAVQQAQSHSYHSSLLPLFNPLGDFTTITNSSYNNNSRESGNANGSSNDNAHLDILIEEHLSIKQDLKNDTTLLEVTSMMPTGSSITITTPKSSIVFHA